MHVWLEVNVIFWILVLCLNLYVRDTSQSILYALYFVQVSLRNAIVEWIAIIKFARNNSK